MKKNSKLSAGFTLIELVIVMGITAILFGFITFNLFSASNKASLSSVTDTLVSDIKSQQVKAMVGFTEGQDINNSYGIYFETNRYVLFRGTSYSPSEPSNFSVNLESNLEFTNITFPSSTVIFSKGSGEVVGFANGSNTITLKISQNTEQKTITINRYGAIISLN